MTLSVFPKFNLDYQFQGVFNLSWFIYSKAKGSEYQTGGIAVYFFQTAI